MIRERVLYLIAVVVFAALALAVVAQQQSASPSRQAGNEKVYKVGEEGLENPRLIRQTTPKYTAEAKQKGAEGKVMLQAVVRKDGSIDSFRVLNTPGYGLDEQAIDEISKNWKFEPGKKDGQPVDVHVSIEVMFTLN